VKLDGGEPVMTIQSHRPLPRTEKVTLQEEILRDRKFVSIVGATATAPCGLGHSAVSRAEVQVLVGFPQGTDFVEEQEDHVKKKSRSEYVLRFLASVSERLSESVLVLESPIDCK